MKHFNRNHVYTAVFMALVLLLGLTPLGLIPLGFVNLTILHIPVIIGTIFLGLKSGIALGLTFGLVSVMSMLGMSMAAPSVLAYTLLEKSPVLAVLMSVVPRLLVPVFTHLVYRLFARGKKYSIPAVPVAAVVGSVTNTVFYLGLMYCFYNIAGLDAELIADKLGVLGLGFFGIIGAIAAGGGGAEAVAAGIVSPAILTALWKIKKRG